MEFQIEVIHREGKLNSADALSRIDTSEKEEHNKNKITCLVTTRAKTKELIHNMDKSNNDHLENDHLNMNSQKNITETGENNKVYNIIEKRGFVFNNREFDHISFFFDKMSCKIKKQLQHKMKKTLEVNNLNYGEILSFDENKSIILIPSILQDEYNRSNAELSIKTLMSFVTQNLCEKIAINIDIRDSQSFFECKKLLKKWFASTDIEITIYLNTIIQVFDPYQMQKIMNEFHCTTQAAHPGWNRMYENIKRHFCWTNMISDIKSFVQNCEICQKVKIFRHTKQPIIISSTPIASFANVAIDHVGKLITSDLGNSYILTAMCVLTKYAIAIPVPDQTDEITAQNLVEKIFLIYGYPEVLTSDNHKTFAGNLLKNICKFLKIHKVFTSPYTPKSNTVERFHSTLGNMLRSFVSNQPTQWENKLPFVLSAYNSSVNTVTGKSPFELVFGKSMTLPSSITNSNIPAYNYDDYAHDLRENLKYSWKFAREQLEIRKQKNKEYFDEKHSTRNLDLKPGDMVLMLNHDKKSKFDMRYIGPFEVIEVTGPNTVKIKEPNKKRTYRAHKDQLKLFNQTNE